MKTGIVGIGLMGQHLVRTLLETGRDVLMPYGVEYRKGDMRGIDEIINLGVFELIPTYTKKHDTHPRITDVFLCPFNLANVLNMEKLFAISGWQLETGLAVGIVRTWNWRRASANRGGA